MQDKINRRAEVFTNVDTSAVFYLEKINRSLYLMTHL
jgi:hypothetical protein